MKRKISQLWSFSITGMHRTSTAACVTHQNMAKQAARQGSCERQLSMSVPYCPLSHADHSHCGLLSSLGFIKMQTEILMYVLQIRPQAIWTDRD